MPATARMQVLWGVDLDVRAGETVLLLGANGAGKTTFLKSLVGLIEARAGQRSISAAKTSRGCAPATGCGSA